MTPSHRTLLDDPDVREAAHRLWPNADEAARGRRAARAAWTVIAEPGDAVAGALVGAIGPEAAIAAAESPGAAPASVGAAIRAARDRWRDRVAPDLVRRALAEALRTGLRLLTPEDEGWPAERLGALGDHAPLALWVRGDVGLVCRLDASIGIVGARAATSYGTHVAGDLAADLCDRGVAVISGAAYGIDGAAHRAALATGGRTVAVVAGGANIVYPAGHARLFAEMADSGAVVSESPPGAAPTKWRFLARNRVIAALGGGLVVVEAGVRSGALNTASHAASIGRPLGAVPGPVTSTTSAGCHRLLREFDAQCITGVDDALELIGVTAHPTLWQDDRLPPDQMRARDALASRHPRDLVEVCRRSGLSREQAQGALGLLELAGLARRTDTGWLLA